MTGKGIWRKGTKSFPIDHDYIFKGQIRAYVRPKDDKFEVVNSARDGKLFDTLEEAKAVAMALVAME